MPAENKKQTFGGVQVSRVAPPPGPEIPKSMLVVLNFEEALKLRLCLDQALLKLNSYNRARRAGRAAAVGRCIYPSRKRVMIKEAKIKSESTAAEGDAEST